MSYGLTDNELAKLRDVFAMHPDIERVVLYGSRAMGNYKPFSDIDITLFGDRLTHDELVTITAEIDDLLLAYQCDISLFRSLRNQALTEHIKRVGIEIYHSGNCM